jgi:hypothetical protein
MSSAAGNGKGRAEPVAAKIEETEVRSACAALRNGAGSTGQC